MLNDRRRSVRVDSCRKCPLEFEFQKDVVEVDYKKKKGDGITRDGRPLHVHIGTNIRFIIAASLLITAYIAGVTFIIISRKFLPVILFVEGASPFFPLYSHTFQFRLRINKARGTYPSH